MSDMIDFRSLNNALNPHSRSLLPQILPGGRFEGLEYTALNPGRYDKNLGSFRINIKSLVWCDFATGDRGQGFISLYSYIKNIKPYAAAKYLACLMNIQSSDIERQSGRKYQSRPCLLFVPWNTPKKPLASESFSPLDAGLQKLILKIWDSATSPIGTAVETYLQKRGIKEEIPPTIRYLPNYPHRGTNTRWPCMLAAVTGWPEKKIIALHRTYLKADGSDKAPVNPSKMMIGKITGGAVRLTAVGEELIIAEGIETALSLIFLSRSRNAGVWAVLTAGNYINLVLPDLPFAHKIIIAADNDPAGRKAAEKAATKWVMEGRKVKIALPPKNSDFNDVLVNNIWE